MLLLNGPVVHVPAVEASFQELQQRLSGGEEEVEEDSGDEDDREVNGQSVLVMEEMPKVIEFEKEMMQAIDGDVIEGSSW